jgi:hypothetical protein
MSCNPCADCPPVNATNLPDCPGGEPCEELVKADCTNFVGPNLPALGILNGDRLNTVLFKLHKVLNGLISPTIPLATYTATNTGTGTNPAPLVVTYLGLGPVYTSTAGATSSGTTITVGSTTGLAIGMTVEVTSGTGAFAANTTVLSIPTGTTFTVSSAPTTALSGGQTIVRATGSSHQQFTINVLKNFPQTFKAFTGSPVKVSGTGTIV